MFEKINMPIALHSCHFFQVPDDHIVIPRVVSDDIEWIEIITAGSVLFEVDGKLVNCARGTAFWHIGGDATIWQMEEPRYFETFVLRMYVPEVRRVLPRVTFLNDDSFVEQLCNDLKRFIRNDDMNSDYFGLYIYNLIFFHVYEAWRRAGERAQPEALRRAVEYIRANPEGDLSVARLAAEAKVSESYLYALFQEHLRRSPHNYVLESRLRLAQSKLADPGNSIKAIAAECGFDSLVNFYRAFARNFGCPPAEYRRKRYGFGE